MAKIFVMAAPSSGTGKTTLSCGLARLLHRRGLKVQCFKIGPDYLDPGFLTVASGNPCHNLDLWMCGEDSLRQSVARAALDHDVILVEGVMGLYDGADAKSDHGSTSHIAKVLGAPVVLVLDAGGCARSMAAMAQGFMEFADSPSFAGIIANRVGSAGHTQMLRESLFSMRNPLPLFGAVAKNAPPQLPERHLGLVQAGEDQSLSSKLDSLAQILEECLDIDALLEQCPTVQIPYHTPKSHSSKTIRVGLAQDLAFTFYYSDFLDGLKARGAEIIPFSPIADPELPPNLDLLIFGGGYPELFARELSQNQSLRSQIQQFGQQGGRIYAECGGLMYLSQAIQPADTAQDSWPMVGLLPSRCLMQNRLQYLGYVQVELAQDCILGAQGSQLRGHEYHHSILDQEPKDWKPIYKCTDARGQNARHEGWSKNQMLISYVHLPLAAFENAMDSLLQL